VSMNQPSGVVVSIRSWHDQRSPPACWIARMDARPFSVSRESWQALRFVYRLEDR
jgi:hypothetical protein